MSTWLDLECIDHDPPLTSDGEVGQHLYDLPRIRKELADREGHVARWLAWLESEPQDPNAWHHFETNSAAFLSQHPKCRIIIRDEYGQVHPQEANI